MPGHCCCYWGFYPMYASLHMLSRRNVCLTVCLSLCLSGCLSFSQWSCQSSWLPFSHQLRCQPTLDALCPPPIDCNRWRTRLTFDCRDVMSSLWQMSRTQKTWATNLLLERTLLDCQPMGDEVRCPSLLFRHSLAFLAHTAIDYRNPKSNRNEACANISPITQPP